MAPACCARPRAARAESRGCSSAGLRPPGSGSATSWSSVAVGGPSGGGGAGGRVSSGRRRQVVNEGARQGERQAGIASLGGLGLGRGTAGPGVRWEARGGTFYAGHLAEFHALSRLPLSDVSVLD